MSGKLYLVATPIGNLEDITIRALNVLREVDLIAAEDTRHTLGLLNHFEISKPLISYYKQTEKARSEVLIEKLREGKNIAIVSDAGTPGISDPGEEIVRVAIENNIEIIPIPGACALINALIVSGLSTKEFTFIGFLSAVKKEKKEKAPKKPKEKKPKKEKEPKKPKEVDLSPPLKKAPVILIVVMAASVLILILLFTNLTGYSNKISEAKEAYAVQDYVGAYEKLSGLKTKEEDAEFYQQMMLLARVQGELLNGDSLYGLGQYTMSLDSYICALGRHDVNYTEATAYHVQGEYDFLAEQIQTQMSEKFGVSAETAREIYALDSRTEYTKRIRDIVKGLGLIE